MTTRLTTQAENAQINKSGSLCEAMITPAYTFMTLGIPGTQQCKNEATTVVSVRTQGKMKLCDGCLKEFKGWATLPFTVKKIVHRLR